MSNRCPTREAEALQLLKDRGEMSLSEMADAMGVKPNTASVYLQALRRQERASNTGMGHTSKWSAVPEDRRQPSAIVQCASVWEYAKRCAI